MGDEDETWVHLLILQVSSSFPALYYSAVNPRFYRGVAVPVVLFAFSRQLDPGIAAGWLNAES